MAMTLSIKDGTYQFSGRSKAPSMEKNRLLETYGKHLHCYGQKLALLPDGGQQGMFSRFIGCARFVHNHYLDARIRYYKEHGKTLKPGKYKKEYLPALKVENPWLFEADKFALEAAIEHVDASYDNFYEKRTRFPKFSSASRPNGSRYTTKQTNGNIRLEMVDGLPYVRLPKIGFVRFVLPKGRLLQDICPAGTRITSAAIIRTGKRYDISLQMETVIDLIHPADWASGRMYAIDMGLKEFCVYGGESEKAHIKNPRFIKLHAKRLRRLQKSLSRKQYDRAGHKGSANYQKALAKVQKEHKKCADQRRDLHHKLSRRLADSCDVFVCEDLNIRGMMKNRQLSKHIASVGWGSFLTFVKYKLERKGGIFLKVGRTFASSQLCSRCGAKNPLVKDLSVRKWACPVCGTRHDRDENAVDNLLHEGARILAAA